MGCCEVGGNFVDVVLFDVVMLGGWCFCCVNLLFIYSVFDGLICRSLYVYLCIWYLWDFYGFVGCVG